MYEQYTDKQIVEMLAPKLRKLSYDIIANNPEHYPDACKLISTIYKSGYIRGQLGRSFIIGKPKQTEHWVPATKDNVKAGSKVRFVNECLHKKYPQYFPCKNTIGEVKMAFGGYNSGICDIQWPKGTTSEIALWFVKFEDLEVLLCE